MNEQHPLTDWLGNTIEVPSQVKPDPKVNPCVTDYGSGPDGKQCWECSHIKGYAMSKTVYKCGIRKNTRSAKTDHKLKWPACSKFESRELMCEGRVKDIPLYDGRS